MQRNNQAFHSLPDWFYRLNSKIDDGFTNIPTDQISFPQILARNPNCFIKQDEVTHTQKKKIIFYDWYYSNKLPFNNNRRKSFVDDLLIYLLRNNFQCFYLHQANHLKSIKQFSSDFTLYEINEKLTVTELVSKTEIDLLASKVNMAADELLILDYFEINRLFKEVGLFPDYKIGQIFGYDIIHAHFEPQAILKSIPPTFPITLVIRERDVEFCKQLLKEAKKFSHIPIHLTLNKNNYKDILHDKYIAENKTYLTLDCGSDLFSLDSLDYLLSPTKIHLENLVLYQYYGEDPLQDSTQIKEWTEKYKDILSSVKKFSLNGISVNFKSFCYILGSMKNLEKLIITNVTIYGKTIKNDIQLLHLKNLNTLVVEGLKIGQQLLIDNQPIEDSEYILKELLLSNLHIEDLSVESMNASNAISAFGNSPRVGFKKLSLVATDVTMDHLKKLIPNLTQLKIKDSYNHTENEYFNISQEDIKDILLIADKLEFFEMNRISYQEENPGEKDIIDSIIEWKSYHPNILPHIKHLSLSNCKEDNFNDRYNKMFLLFNPLNEIGDPQRNNISYRHPQANRNRGGYGIPSDFAEEKPDLPLNRPTYQKTSIDADTKINTDKVYNLEKIFFAIEGQDPDLTSYRLHCYNTLKLPQEKVDQCHFELTNEGGEDWEERYIPVSNKNVYADMQNMKDKKSLYYAKTSLILDDNWQPLPSLSVADELLKYHVKPSVACKIAYSKRDSMYYIQSANKTRTKIKIDYCIRVPPSLCNRHEIPSKNMPQIIRDLHLKYKAFGEAALNFKGPGNGEDFINAIIKEKTGACRHRSVAFKYEIDTKFSDYYRCRIVKNGCHDFVEICEKIDGSLADRKEKKEEWITVDLGGYTGKLVVKETYRPSLDQVQSNQKKNTPIIPQTHSVSKGKNNTDFFDEDPHLFETWKTPEILSDEIEKSCSQIANFSSKKDIKNSLVYFENQDTINHFLPSFLNVCQKIKRKVYYINCPDDLVCYTSSLTLNDDFSGKINESPGPLHQFLAQNNDEEKILVVNWSNFSPEKIIQCQSIIANKPTLDGIAISNNIKIVGLYSSTGPNVYEESDFHNGIHRTFKNIIPSENFKNDKNNIPTFIKAPTEKPNKVKTIELYQSNNWRSFLFGHWHTSETGLQFKKGPLLKALDQGISHVIINNGPWDNPEFERFWQEAKQNRGFTLYNKRFNLPDNFTLEIKSGYDWPQLAENHTYQTVTAPQGNTFIFNPSTAPYFFTNYTVKDNTLDSLPGFLKEHQEGILHLHITRPLPMDLWGRLFKRANKLKIKLQITTTNQTILPSEILNHIKKLPPRQHEKILQDKFYFSEDYDKTLDELLKNHPQSLVIDVSELKISDILYLINPRYQENKTIHFDISISDIWKTITEEKKTVILTGQFSQELIDHLSSFSLGYTMINGKREKVPNNVFLVPKNGELFKGLLPVPDIKEVKQDYIKQKTKNRFNNIPQPEYDPWKGLLHCDANDHLPLDEDQTDENFCNNLDTYRFKQVKDILSCSPFVFLAGKTGIGKSTFVEKIYAEHAEISEIYREETQILEWIADSTQKEKILFIDESNLSSREWSRYEGLFNNPPGLLVNGKYHILDKYHKVIFAGNPLSYGGERHLPSFFDRHGSSVVFQPFPARYIAHRVLQPILKTLPMNVQKTALTCFQRIYNHIVSISGDTILITPREMEMMAQMVIAYYHENMSDENIQSLIFYSAYKITKNVIPDSNKNHFNQWFDNAFAPHDNLTTTFSNECPHQFKLKEDFVVPKSRYDVYQTLYDFLTIRNKKIENKTYAGLGGLILEGDTGSGKRSFILQMLRYHKCDFFHLPVKADPKEKEKQLLEAARKGQIVLIDEINSSPVSEKLLNALLMGKDLEGKAVHPGFLLIGTQKPIMLKGRKATSLALQRRLYKEEVPPYTCAELKEIIYKKYSLPNNEKTENIINSFIKRYDEKLQYAKKNNFSPIPTPRHLFNVVKKYVQKGFRESVDLIEEIRDQNNDRDPNNIKINISEKDTSNREDDSNNIAHIVNNREAFSGLGIQEKNARSRLEKFVQKSNNPYGLSKNDTTATLKKTFRLANKSLNNPLIYPYTEVVNAIAQCFKEEACSKGCQPTFFSKTANRFYDEKYDEKFEKFDKNNYEKEYNALKNKIETFVNGKNDKKENIPSHVKKMQWVTAQVTEKKMTFYQSIQELYKINQHALADTHAMNRWFGKRTQSTQDFYNGFRADDEGTWGQSNKEVRGFLDNIEKIICTTDWNMGMTGTFYKSSLTQVEGKIYAEGNKITGTMQKMLDYIHMGQEGAYTPQYVLYKIFILADIANRDKGFFKFRSTPVQEFYQQLCEMSEKFKNEIKTTQNLFKVF